MNAKVPLAVVVFHRLDWQWRTTFTVILHAMVAIFPMQVDANVATTAMEVRSAIFLTDVAINRADTRFPLLIGQ